MTGETHGQGVKAAILTEGLALWRIDPATVSARRIAKQLGMTHANILYHFGSTAGLKNAIALEAIRVGDRKVIPMLIACGHEAAARLSPEERQAYLSRF
jgi:AcrR family transcriptional regulator